MTILISLTPHNVLYDDTHAIAGLRAQCRTLSVTLLPQPLLTVVAATS